jgi:hypothetical protein
MNHAMRLTKYLEAIADLFPKLSAEEQEEFERWRLLPSSRRNSDWPGWVRHLGPRPGAGLAQEMRRTA